MLKLFLKFLLGKRSGTKSQSLIRQWIDAGNKKVATIKEFKNIQRFIQQAWDGFRRVFPTVASVVLGIGKATSASFRGIQKFYQNHQVAITTA